MLLLTIFTPEDRTGGLLAWVSVSLLLSLAAHLSLALTSLNPLPALVTMGLTYAVLSSALWSLPALMVSQNKLATAFGIMQVTFRLNRDGKSFFLL